MLDWSHWSEVLIVPDAREGRSSFRTPTVRFIPEPERAAKVVGSVLKRRTFDNLLSLRILTAVDGGGSLCATWP